MIKNLFSVSRCWHPVRSKPGPGFLHSHSAVKLQSWMVLFGGEREGQTVNEVWRFHFGEFTNSLQTIQLSDYRAVSHYQRNIKQNVVTS